MATAELHELDLSIIGPDSFQVSRRERRSCKAVLGCGVGLVLVDREANAGGLLHMLGVGLLSPDSCRNLLVEFLEELYSHGAQPERLTGMLAGGILLGGGARQLEEEPGAILVHRLLELLGELDLPPIDSETGGPFASTLGLDLATLRWDLLLHHPEPTEELSRSLGQPPVFDLETSVGHVKPIPQIALEALAIIARPNYRMRDLADIIQKDQVITARVLGWCNTAGVVIGQEIWSIDQALMRMGEKKLLQLVLAATLSGYFAGQDTGYAQCRGGLFHHALACAYLSAELAELLAPNLVPLAFTAGLLHDIGKVVLDQEVCRQAPEFYRVLRDEQSLLAAERHVLGVTHEEAGHVLASRWGLAEPLGNCIRWHHDPHQAPAHEDLCALVGLADRLTRVLWQGQQPWEDHEDEIPDLLARFGMPGASLSALLIALPLAGIHRQVSLA